MLYILYMSNMKFPAYSLIANVLWQECFRVIIIMCVCLCGWTAQPEASADLRCHRCVCGVIRSGGLMPQACCSV